MLHQNCEALLAMNGLGLVLSSSGDTNGPEDALAIARGWALAMLSSSGHRVRAQIRQEKEKEAILWASESEAGWVLDPEQIGMCKGLVGGWEVMTMDIEEEEEAVRRDLETRFDEAWAQVLMSASRKKQRVSGRSLTISREEQERLLLEQHDHQSALRETIEDQARRLEWMVNDMLLQKEDQDEVLRGVVFLQSDLDQLRAHDMRDTCHLAVQTDLQMGTLRSNERRLRHLEVDFAALTEEIEMRQPTHVGTETELDKSYILKLDEQWAEVNRVAAETAEKVEAMAKEAARVAVIEADFERREADLLQREEAVAQEKAKDEGRKADVQKGLDILDSRTKEVHAVEEELRVREAVLEGHERDCHEREMRVSDRENGFADWLQTLIDRETVVQQKEDCLGGLEERERAVTLRELEMCTREQREGTIAQRENHVATQEANVHEHAAAVVIREGSIQQREQLQERREAAFQKRVHRNRKEQALTERLYAELETLWMEMEEREVRARRVDQMMAQREAQLMKWWQQVEESEQNVDARAAILEEREVGLGARETADEKRADDIEQRHASIQIRELEVDEREKRQQDRQVMLDKRGLEQDEREETLVARSRETDRKNTEITERETAMRVKDREVTKREKDVDEKDKTMRQEKKLLSTQKAEVVKKEAELSKFQTELDIRETGVQDQLKQLDLARDSLEEAEYQLQVQEQGLKDKEVEHEQKMKALTKRQRELIHRQKEAGKQESDLERREGDLLNWMKEMEYRERQIEGSEQLLERGPGVRQPPEQVQKRFNESLVSVQLRLAKERYVHEKEKRLKSKRELPVVDTRWDIVDEALEECNIKLLESSVVQESKYFRKSVSQIKAQSLGGQPVAGSLDLSHSVQLLPEEDRSVQRVQQKDTELNEEVLFLANLETCPLVRSEDYVNNEHLVAAVTKWWKYTHKKVMQRKLLVLQERKRLLDNGMAILEAKDKNLPCIQAWRSFEASAEFKVGGQLLDQRERLFNLTSKMPDGVGSKSFNATEQPKLLGPGRVQSAGVRRSVTPGVIKRPYSATAGSAYRSRTPASLGNKVRAPSAGAKRPPSGVKSKSTKRGTPTPSDGEASAAAVQIRQQADALLESQTTSQGDPLAAPYNEYSPDDSSSQSSNSRSPTYTPAA